MPVQIARQVQVLLTLAIIVAAVVLIAVMASFLAQFTGVFILFFLAWLVAYLTKPVVRTVSRSGLPFGVSTLLVYLIGPALTLVAAILLVPAIITQASQMIGHLDEYSTKVSSLVDDAKGALSSLGMSEADIHGVGDKIREVVGSIGQGVLQGSINTLGGVGNLLFQITLILIFSISFLLDGDKLGESALAALPSRWRDGATLVVKSVQTSFGSFVRGQLLAALVYAAMNAVIMLAFGLPDVLIGALAAGLLVIVPLVGNYLSFIPPLVICLVVRPDATLILLVVLVVVQGVYMNVISPRIMSKAVHMHPLFTMGSILVFGQLWGFWGGLFGIPIASTIGMLARPTMDAIQNYMNPAPAPQSLAQPESQVILLPQDIGTNGKDEAMEGSLSAQISPPASTPDIESDTG